MNWKKTTALGLAIGLIFSGSQARMKEGLQTGRALPAALWKAAAIPNTQQCTHKVGRLWFTVTNYGFFGNGGDRTLQDCLTLANSSSAEFPGGSRIEYLFQGALWVGGVVSGDTLVSTGNDGWLSIQELWPDAGAGGGFVRRSTNSFSPYYSPNAISDQDLIAVMYDTLIDPTLASPDPQDARQHQPMGLKVIQNSYSWATGWGQDWVMLDYKIVNIGRRLLRDVYLGIFVDADVGFQAAPTGGVDNPTDDLSGFKVSVPNDLAPACPDTINLAYISDNDGDPIGETFSPRSPTGATGVRVVRAPGGLGSVKTSFNWWTPNGNTNLDWAPQKTPGRKGPSSGSLGQPEGDAMKYAYLSNGEFDYDQVYAALKENSRPSFLQGQGWLEPLTPEANAIDIANGYDTRYLISFGPFNLPVLNQDADFDDDTLAVTLGYIAGEGFHKEARNFTVNLGINPNNYKDTAKIIAYQNGLDFTALAGNARWVQRVFDNETFEDTVLCGGQLVPRQHGDGIPDFRGPQPPPNPQVFFTSELGKITVRWFGRNSETARDSFSKVEDFEGYRVFISSDGLNYTLAGSYDRVNWKPYFFNRSRCRWDPAPIQPLTYAEIQAAYANKWDTTGTLSIDPEKFTGEGPKTNTGCSPNVVVNPAGPLPDTSSPGKIFNIHYCNDCGLQRRPVDTAFYFVRQDYNLGLNQAKLYPGVTDPTNDSTYWYQFELAGLFPSQPVYVSVVPFDFGLATPSQTIDPLEGLPASNAQLQYALPSEQTRQDSSLKVSVYPNPYRVDHDYSFYERPDPNRTEEARRLNFINLPASCVIRIYTLDGDLVQEIKHQKNPAAPDAGFNQWNLVSRNTQPVAPGLYLYTVQSAEKVQMGKIVIIK